MSVRSKYLRWRKKQKQQCQRRNKAIKRFMKKHWKIIAAIAVTAALSVVPGGAVVGRSIGKAIIGNPVMVAKVAGLGLATYGAVKVSKSLSNHKTMIMAGVAGVAGIYLYNKMKK